MTVLITGVAGVIGFHTAMRLLQRNETVIGLDNMNDSYSLSIKKLGYKNFIPIRTLYFIKLIFQSLVNLNLR